MLDAVTSGGLLAAGAPVVAMVSGGRDSVCLLDLAVRAAGARAVRALHVNYGLRADAGADAEHCRELCDLLGVELVTREAGPAPEAGNLQAWARRVRYREADAVASAAGPDAVVATGHTATDQVETIMYRLASSPSRRALLGMRPRDGRLVRPLLGFTREQTAAYCRARGLAWREDQTNESSRYARGRVRAKLVPALREIHPAAEANVLALAELLRDEADALDVLVEQVLAGRSSVELARLRTLAPAVARLVVQRLADEAAGRPAPGTARRLGEILALRETGTAALDLPSGVRATAVRGVVTFSRRPPAGVPAAGESALGADPS